MSNCIMQPKNFGIFCEKPENCEKCGWNPAEAKRRRAETIAKIEKEKKHE